MPDKDKTVEVQNKAKSEVSEVKVENLNFKCEQFFGKNWRYIFFFIGFAILFVSYQISSINSRMTDLEKTVAENNGKVVMTTVDGRAIKVTKEPLKAELLRQFTASILVNNLVISRSTITNDFSKTVFKNYSELLSSVQPLANIYKNFLDSQDTKDNKKDTQAIGDFVAYLQWLLSAVAQDKLPEFITIKDYVIEEYKYEGNKFEISLAIKTFAQSYLIASDSYVTQQGVFKIYAEGSFNLDKSSDVNPYGLRFHRLKVTALTKAKGN